MKNVGDADIQANGTGLHRGKGGMIIHEIVGQEDFLAAAAAEIESREIVQGARCAHAYEQPIVFFVPEVVNGKRGFYSLGLGRLDGRLRIGGLLSENGA